MSGDGNVLVPGTNWSKDDGYAPVPVAPPVVVVPTTDPGTALAPVGSQLPTVRTVP